MATLENPNGWHRDTASRLLYERQDKAAAGPLGDLVKHSKFALARMHALHSLEGLQTLNEELVMAGLNDPDENVREHAVKLAEGFFRLNAPPISLPITAFGL